MLYSVLLYISIAVAVLVIVVLAWLWYMGLFSKITISLREVSEMTIINMNYTGSYQDCCKGFTDMEQKTKKLLGELGDIPVMGSAYYTAPSEVADPKDNRWSCFFVLNDVPELLAKAKALPKSTEYTVLTIPKSRAISGTFVHRNSLSYMFGPMKVYPAITKFMNETLIKAVGCIELYHSNKQPIDYYMYIDNEKVFEEMKKTTFVAADQL